MHLYRHRQMMLGCRPMCWTPFQFLHTLLSLFTKNYSNALKLALQNIEDVAVKPAQAGIHIS